MRLIHLLRAKINTYLFLARLWWWFQYHSLQDFERALFFHGYRPYIVDENTRIYHIGRGRVEITESGSTVEITVKR